MGELGKDLFTSRPHTLDGADAARKWGAVERHIQKTTRVHDLMMHMPTSTCSAMQRKCDRCPPSHESIETNKSHAPNMQHQKHMERS